VLGSASDPTLRRSVVCARARHQLPDLRLRFCPREAEELSQSVLADHGGGSLVLMHERSLNGCVDSRQLESSTFAANRKRVVSWLTKAFLDFHLRDEWLVATLTLLDRLAATRAAATRTPARVPGKPASMGPLDPECLAAVLCVLKLSSAEAEMDTLSLKELIIRLADEPRPAPAQAMWGEVLKAEFRVYRTLNYRVAVPTAADLAGRVALDVQVAARKSFTFWPGLLKERLRAPSPELTTEVCRFTLLVSFLVELGLTLVAEAAYGQSLPPAALALVAVEHALQAFGDAPMEGVEAVDIAKRDTLGAEASRLLSPLSLAVHSVWVSPPAGSKVHRKWEDRADDFVHGALPVALGCRWVEEPPLTPDRVPRQRSTTPTTGPRPSPSKLVGVSTTCQGAANTKNVLDFCSEPVGESAEEQMMEAQRAGNRVAEAKSHSCPVAKAPASNLVVGPPGFVRHSLRDMALGKQTRPVSLALLSLKAFVPEPPMLQRTRPSVAAGGTSSVALACPDGCQPTHRRPKRVLEAPADPNAENSRMTASTCRFFEDVFAAPQAKRRKVAQSSSKEVPVANLPRQKKRVSLVAKENTSLNRMGVRKASQARFEVGQEVEVLRGAKLTWSLGKILEVTPEMVVVRILIHGIAQVVDMRMDKHSQNNIRICKPQEETEAQPLEPRCTRPLGAFCGPM